MNIFLLSFVPHRDARENKDDQEEEQYYSSRQTAPVLAEAQNTRLKRANMEVISVQQLKDGLEFYFK